MRVASGGNHRNRRKSPSRVHGAYGRYRNRVKPVSRIRSDCFDNVPSNRSVLLAVMVSKGIGPNFKEVNATFPSSTEMSADRS